MAAYGGSIDPLAKNQQSDARYGGAKNNKLNEAMWGSMLQDLGIDRDGQMASATSKMRDAITGKSPVTFGKVPSRSLAPPGGPAISNMPARLGLPSVRPSVGPGERRPLPAGQSGLANASGGFMAVPDTPGKIDYKNRSGATYPDWSQVVSGPPRQSAVLPPGAAPANKNDPNYSSAMNRFSDRRARGLGLGGLLPVGEDPLKDRSVQNPGVPGAGAVMRGPGAFPGPAYDGSGQEGSVVGMGGRNPLAGSSAVGWRGSANAIGPNERAALAAAQSAPAQPSASPSPSPAPSGPFVPGGMAPGTLATPSWYNPAFAALMPQAGGYGSPVSQPAAQPAPQPVSQPAPQSASQPSARSAPFADRQPATPLTLDQRMQGISSRMDAAGMIDSMLGSGAAQYTPAMGGMVTNTQTGRPVEYDIADGVQRKAANEIVDDALARRSWNEGIGVGDQMNARRQAEVDDVMQSNREWYARKGAETQAAAAAAGMSVEDYKTNKAKQDKAVFNQMRLDAAKGVAEQDKLQAQIDELNPRNVAYRERLKESRERNDAATARRNRFERGLPNDENEAALFAMQRGMMQNPNEAMRSFGALTGRNDAMDYQTDAMSKSARDSALLQAMQYGNESRMDDRRLTMEEQKFKEQMNQQRRENAIALASLSPDRAYADAVSVARGKGMSEPQAQLEGQRAREMQIANINMLAENPEFRDMGLRPYGGSNAPQFTNQPTGQGGVAQPTVNGMTPNEAILNARPGGAPITTPAQGSNPMSATTRPNLGVDGFGLGGNTGPVGSEVAKQFYDALKLKYGNALTPEIYQQEKQAAGIIINDDADGEIRRRANLNSNQNWSEWSDQANPMFWALGGNTYSDETKKKAQNWADLFKLETGQEIVPQQRTWSQFFGDWR